MNSTRKKVVKSRQLKQTSIASRGEPALWSMGGTLVLGVLMIVAFLILILWNGLVTFYPGKIERIVLPDGKLIAGEATRSETYRPPEDVLASLDENARVQIKANNGFAKRTLYKTGNFDLYNSDYQWVNELDIRERTFPKHMYYFERMEWGPFIGFIQSADFGQQHLDFGPQLLEKLGEEHNKAETRREEINRIERKNIGDINYEMEQGRLDLRSLELSVGKNSDRYVKAAEKYRQEENRLKAQYAKLQSKSDAIKQENARYKLNLVDVGGQKKSVLLSDIVRFYDANELSLFDSISIYLSRWVEFLTTEPREANTEGGVMPAIFGTLCMTLLLVVAVTPFGVMAALYLREYAKQGHLVSIVRICVNNLAGVPSIVYGVFGLGFFAYTIGGWIDKVFYPEKLPSPTFGTGGLLWAALTLALLTVPVVIVATEEALAAVPQSLREGSLACGASKWQTIKNVVLPKAMPGILTGLILAMARGAGEVAPLMLVGVVKMAPALPIDGHFPFIHLERSFMHLGFQIFDVGFQSRNAEAGKPMVFVTTLLLIFLVAIMNAVAIVIRNRLNRRFSAGHF